MSNNLYKSITYNKCILSFLFIKTVMGEGSKRNKQCKCNSGNTYKKCCFLKDLENKNKLIESNKFWEKIGKGETSFFSRIISTNGEGSSMDITDISTTYNGIKRNLINEKITLSVEEDKNTDISMSSATIICNHKGESTIYTTGRGSIKNFQDFNGIYSIHGGKIITTTRKGHKAKISIKQQKDKGHDLIDVLFLIGKEHPHIVFYPDGNGKYIGSRGFKCSLEGVLNYLPTEKTIHPNKVKITIDNLLEVLIIEFKFDIYYKKIKIIKAYFKPL